MKRPSTPTAVLIIAAIGASCRAFTGIDSLMRELHNDVTVIGLGMLFLLGYITGVAFGLKRKLLSTE